MKYEFFVQFRLNYITNKWIIYKKQKQQQQQQTKHGYN